MGALPLSARLPSRVPLLPLVACGAVAVVMLATINYSQRAPQEPTYVIRTATDIEATRQTTGLTDWHRNGSTALQAWRSALFPRMAKAYTALEAGEYNSTEGREKNITRLEPNGLRRFDLFDPVLACPPGQELVRWGDGGDGGKLLCPMEELRKERCLVLSIGSNGQTDFEEAVLKETACEVHTFDCTYDGGSIDPERHTYHKICLGDASEMRKELEFKTLPDIVAMLGGRTIDLLKIDIEGFEYEVVSGFQFPTSCNFPTQISMEVHYKHLYMWTGLDNRDTWSPMIWPMHQLSMGELAVFFGHLADLGYAIVSREDNAQWGEGCCAEFTFVRVEQPAHCTS